MKRLAFAWLATFGLASIPAGMPTAAYAQDDSYPQRPVRIVVGFAPGGGIDLMARFVGKKLGERLGQPFVVENRPGAGGTIGANVVAKAKPDGHTLLMSGVGHAINQSLYSKLPFDSVKDFTAVGPVARGPNTIAVNPSLPVRTLAELVDYAKRNPGQVSYGAVGGSTTMYLGMALFESMAGIKMQYVPYNGTMPSVQAAMAGHVQVVSCGYGSAEPFARTGQLRVLAISTAQATPLAPGVPTIAEAAGLPGYDVVNWIGMFAPAGTPTAVVDKLNGALQSLQADPEMRQFLDSQKVEAFHQKPAEFHRLVVADIARYARIVQQTGATSQ